MPEGPITAGSGRIVLDAEPGKGSVRVVRVERTEMSVATTRGYAQGVAFSTHLVCSKTPCAIDLPAGSHELVFQATRDERDVSAATFDVTAGRTQVVRHAVGHYEPHMGWKVLGTTGLTLGITGALAGGLLLPVGQMVDSDGVRTAGIVTLGVGVGVLALGIASLVIGRTEIQPGATTQWPLKQDGADEQPTSTHGDEHVRRDNHAKPMVIATGHGVGVAW